MSGTTLRRERYGFRRLTDQVLEPFLPDEDGFLVGWGMPQWEDHFDNPTINSSVWNVRNNTQDAQDTSTTRTANVIIENSSLKLRAKKETYQGRDYTSGYVDTIGKWSRRYGRFEMRCKIPTTPNQSRGLWPGFWLRDNSGGGEADIMEAIGSPNNHQNIWPASPGRHSHALYKQTGVQATNEYWNRECSEIDSADGEWHNYAVEWTPEGFVYFHDGFPVETVSPADYATYFASGFPSQVNIRIDLFIGSSWQGWPNDTDTILPADFTIDWVRYWELP